MCEVWVNYIYQLSKSVFEWVGKYVYDFYLPDYNCIVETHGGQHYKDVAWSSSSITNGNDKHKMHLTISNGINSYIQLDCRESTLKFISNSILNNELPKILNIEKDKIKRTLRLFAWNCKDITIVGNFAQNRW